MTSTSAKAMAIERQGPPPKAGAERRKAEQRLINPEHGVEARRPERHPGQDHEDEGEGPSEPRWHRQPGPAPEHAGAKPEPVRHAPGDEGEPGAVPQAAERHRR